MFVYCGVCSSLLPFLCLCFIRSKKCFSPLRVLMATTFFTPCLSIPSASPRTTLPNEPVPRTVPKTSLYRGNSNSPRSSPGPQVIGITSYCCNIHQHNPLDLKHSHTFGNKRNFGRFTIHVQCATTKFFAVLRLKKTVVFRLVETLNLF